MINRKLLLVDIKAGLGNQLFQYATAYALAKRTGRTLMLVNHCGRERDFALSNYAITQPVVGNKFRLNYTSRKKPAYWMHKLSGLKVQTWTDPLFALDERIITDSPADVLVLQGYWAWKEYFLDCRAELTSLFTHGFKDLIKSNFFEQGLTASVAIHIRRGDYTQPENAKIFCQVPIDYYSKAIGYLDSKIKAPIYYVFTDDDEYFQRELKARFLGFTDRPIILTRSDLSPSSVLFAMASCSHQITANSTFSWWAGFLNSNPEKLVIQPKNWYMQSPHQKVYEQENLLTDDGWVKI